MHPLVVPQATWATAWNAIVPLLQPGAIKPIVAKTFPLARAADALRYLVEGRPLRQSRPHNLTGSDEEGIPEFLSTENATGIGFSFGPLGPSFGTHAFEYGASSSPFTALECGQAANCQRAAASLA